MSKPKISDFSFLPENVRKSYEFDIKAGTFRADSEQDHRNGMEALSRMQEILAAFEYQQTLTRRPPVPIQGAASALVPISSVPTVPKSEKFSVVVVDMWLAERAKKNAERTVAAKKYHMDDFRRRMIKGNPEINVINKSTIVQYKNLLLNKEGQTGKTVDNKLMTLMDFFKYAANNGIYTVSNTNPVDGLFVLSKAERVAKNDPYDAFEQGELEILFEPSAYRAHMNAPDLFWGPLIGIYTGVRISDVAAIRCADIKRSENNIDYIFVPKSKTNAGTRNVPIADALIKLGFLDYVNEVREAGAERLFPHRSFVNGTYSKRLSEELRKYQKKRGLKVVGERKSFHSFRVNVITALANSGANTVQVMKIVGHETGEKGLETHLGYIRDLPDLKDVINRLSWSIDRQGLSYHGEFKEFVSNPKNWAEARKKRGKAKTQ